MSILLGRHVGMALGTLGALATLCAFVAAPQKAKARTCGILSNSFQCMTGARKKAARHAVRVASIQPTRSLNDAGSQVLVARPVRKSRRKAALAAARARKLRFSRRRKYMRHKRRANKRWGRHVRVIHTVGSRYQASAVRRLTRRSLRRSGRSGKHGLANRHRASVQRGWRRRAKGFDYRTANRGVNTSCFPARLRALLHKVSVHYGRQLIITSGYRSPYHNRRIGGARRSQHMHCKAADFYIPGVNKYALARYLKRLPGRGGVGTYSGNRTVHLDIGPRRSWHWGAGHRYANRRRNRHYRVSHRRTKRRVSRRRFSARFRGAKI